MTLYQFNSLKEVEKLRIILYLKPIAKRTDEMYSYDLYAVDSFYIEITYAAADCTLIGLRSFKTITLLEPYLEQIDISNCLNQHLHQVNHVISNITLDVAATAVWEGGKSLCQLIKKRIMGEFLPKEMKHVPMMKQKQ